jgi:hypothetical protein
MKATTEELEILMEQLADRGHNQHLTYSKVGLGRTVV